VLPGLTGAGGASRPGRRNFNALLAYPNRHWQSPGRNPNRPGGIRRNWLNCGYRTHPRHGAADGVGLDAGRVGLARVQQLRLGPWGSLGSGNGQVSATSGPSDYRAEESKMLY
jgi:hypothetical protein